jgi:hypothetical protein
MHEIGVQSVLAGRNAVEQLVSAPNIERVPAHMRNFQAGIGRFDRDDIAGNPVESLRHLMFEPARRHELHADADTEKRLPLFDDGFVERLDHAADRVKAAPAIGERADAGQHDALGLANVLGIAGQAYFGADAAFARGALQRLLRGVQIARPIVNDRDTHHASASGKVPMTRSFLGAAGVTGRKRGSRCCVEIRESQRP